jgi:predicted Fe-Mo cluster-binding NifX family protein
MIIAVATESGIDFNSFVYFRIEGNKVKEKEEVKVPPGGVDQLVKQFLGLEIDLLITNILSPQVSDAFEEHGIHVIPNISGKSDIIMAAYLNGTLNF